jgi:hypothetical protein
MNISIWTSWPKSTKPECNFSKLRTDTTECPLNFRTNSIKNSPNATKSDRPSKTWKEKLPERPLTADQTSQSRAIKFKNGSRGKLKSPKNSKTWDYKFSEPETLLTKMKKYWKKKKNSLKAFTWSTFNNSRSKIK